LCLIGVRLLAVWGFCLPWGVRLLPLGGCGLCLSFGALGFLPALGVSLPFGGWLWLVLFFDALELLPALVCFSFPLFAVIGICPLVLVPCRFRLPCEAPGLALWLKSG
jgi:hypothetical protein